MPGFSIKNEQQKGEIQMSKFKTFIIILSSAFLVSCGSGDKGNTDDQTVKASSTDGSTPKIACTADFSIEWGDEFELSDLCTSESELLYTGSVNTKKAGNYKLTVTATDADGDMAIVNTTVNVKSEPTPEPTSTPEPTPDPQPAQQQTQQASRPTQNYSRPSYQAPVQQPVQQQPAQQPVQQPSTPSGSSGMTGSSSRPSGGSSSGSSGGSSGPSVQVFGDQSGCLAMVNQYGGSCYPMADGSGVMYTP